jgi:NhaP-type Na+/H+ or K+/H+ antiporter
VNTVLVVLVVASLVAALLPQHLRRLHLQAPVVLVAAGVLTGQFTHFTLVETLNSEMAQHAAEVILAVLLFVDATSVRGGRLWGDDPRSVARLLLLALPLALGATVLAGWMLLPGLPWAALLVVACVITPIDFAPAPWIVRDRRIPARVRAALNVEGGYNDGIISPVFLFALALAGAESNGTPLDALATAVPSSLKAIAIGVVLGGVVAFVLGFAQRRRWTDTASGRLVIVLVPLLTYLVAVRVDGNGFVASFVSGIAFRAVHEWRSAEADAAQWEADFQLIEDTSHLLSLAMWFVFGNIAVYVIVLGIPWQAVLLTILSLTVLRLGPVLVAMTRARFDWRERMQLGLLGPRGTTTIVFGLLAFNGLPEGALADTAVVSMTLVVVGSVLLHNLAALTLRPARA